MKFVICIWALDTPEKTVQDLAVSGVTAVELGPQLFMDKDEPAIESMSQRFTDAGIKIFSAHAPFGEENNLSSLDDGARKLAVKNHKKMLHRAAIAGVNYVVIHPGAEAEEAEITRMEIILPSSLQKLVKVAEEVGIKLALENMLPQHPGCESSKLREAVEAVSSPWLGVCFDTGHAHICSEGVNNAFATLRDVTIAFHLQDNDKTWDRHLQPPYGTIDWTEFSKAFKAMNFTDAIAIEAIPWAGASWKVQLKEVEALLTVGQLSIFHNGTSVKLICRKCGHYLFGTEQKWFCGCGGG